MIFRTLNSTYEVDYDNSRIRRLTGINSPTPNQGTDGEWREFHSITMVYNGCQLIQWDEFGNDVTLTSPVQRES